MRPKTVHWTLTYGDHLANLGKTVFRGVVEEWEVVVAMLEWVEKSFRGEYMKAVCVYVFFKHPKYGMVPRDN